MTLNEFKAYVEGVMACTKTDHEGALKLILEKLKTVSEPQQPSTPAWVPRSPDKFNGPSPFEGPTCGGVVGRVDTGPRTAVGLGDPYADRLVARG